MMKIRLLISVLPFVVLCTSALAEIAKPEAKETTPYARQLASDNAAEDINHYHEMTRRLGLTIGMMMPQGDFLGAFGNAPAIGIHYTWEAIRPFGFTLGMMHSGSTFKGNAATGKLAITEISLVTQASFPTGRFLPFVKFGGSFLFNHVSFDATRTVTAGNDSTLTTVGVIAGLGCDFVVGREVGLGFEALYHYAVPKTLNTTSGNFNLGSPFMTFGMRLSF